MQSYSVFGGSLRSVLDFPELPPGHAARARWTLERSAAPPAGEGELLGEDSVDVAVRVRLYRISGGFRLDYDDTGSFDVLRGGSRIVWYPGSDPEPGAVRLDVLGRVLPAALHAAGTLCLHGSAVAVGESGIAFLAPKHHGKSTLAHAMAAAGARLASDDVVPVTPGPPALMAPGVPSVRLWSDALAELAPELHRGAELPRTKHALDPLPPSRLLQAEVPLEAIYLLRPRAASEGEPALRRGRLAPLAATLEILQETKLGALLGKGEAALLLDRVGTLAQTVPVYELELTRGWRQLARAVEQLHAWHPAPSAASAAAGAR